MKRIPAAAAFAATWSALSPSLIPRTWWMTAINVGMNAVAGQKLAEAVDTFTGPLRRTTDVPDAPPPAAAAPEIGPLEPEIHWRRNSLVLAAAAVGTGLALRRSMTRQTEIGRLTGIHSDTAWQQLAGFAVGNVGWLAADALFSASSGMRRMLVHRIRRRLPFLPEALLTAATTAAAISAWRSLTTSTLHRLATRAVISDFARPTTSPRPIEPERTGSRHSLEPFSTLGFHGRGFVTAGPRAARISTVMTKVLARHDRAREVGSAGEERPAGESTAVGRGGVSSTGDERTAVGRTPIRVFIGRLAHPDFSEAADAAVAELERAGAFDREAILLVTNTGSGWIPQWTVESVEYLTGGDCATAAVQYSFAGSWLAFLIFRRQAEESSRELFEAVRRRIDENPPERRPRLYVTGESLGALGGHGAFADLAQMRRRISGALWTGTPRSTRIHAELTARRRRTSTEILPVVGRGDEVRFVSRPEDLGGVGLTMTEWSGARVVYAQHASDPVVWWSPRLIWRRPDWLAEERGRDVSPAVRWMPWITFWQLSTDMPRSVSVPGGHGHNYHREVVHYWNEILGTGLSPAACARIGDAIADDIGPKVGSLPMVDPGPWQAGAVEGQRRDVLGGVRSLLASLSESLPASLSGRLRVARPSASGHPTGVESSGPVPASHADARVHFEGQ